MAPTAVLQRTRGFLAALRPTEHDDLDSLSEKEALLAFMRQVMVAHLEPASHGSPAEVVAQIAASLSLESITVSGVELETTTAHVVSKGNVLPESAEAKAEAEGHRDGRSPKSSLVDGNAHSAPHSTSTSMRPPSRTSGGMPPCVPSAGRDNVQAPAGPPSSSATGRATNVNDSAWIQKASQRRQPSALSPTPIRQAQTVATPQWDKVVRRLSWQGGASAVQSRPQGKQADLRAILGYPRLPDREVSRTLQAKRRCLESPEAVQQMPDSAAKGSAEEIEEPVSEPRAAALGLERTPGESFSPVSETPSSWAAADCTTTNGSVALEAPGVSGCSALRVCFLPGFAHVLCAGAWSSPDSNGWARCGLAVWRVRSSGQGLQKQTSLETATAWWHTSAASRSGSEWLDFCASGGGQSTSSVIHPGHILVVPYGSRPPEIDIYVTPKLSSTLRVTPFSLGGTVEMRAPGAQQVATCVLSVPKDSASSTFWLLCATEEGQVLLWDSEDAGGAPGSVADGAGGTFLPLGAPKGASHEFKSLIKSPQPGLVLGHTSIGNVFVWSCQSRELLAVCQPPAPAIRQLVLLEAPPKATAKDLGVIPFFAMVEGINSALHPLVPLPGVIAVDTVHLGEPTVVDESFTLCCAAASGDLCAFGTDTGEVVVGDWSLGACRAMGSLHTGQREGIQQLFISEGEGIVVAGTPAGGAFVFGLSNLL